MDREWIRIAGGYAPHHNGIRMAVPVHVSDQQIRSAVGVGCQRLYGRRRSERAIAIRESHREGSAIARA
jgi:hypothetical protein